MDTSSLRDTIAAAGMAKFRQFGIRRVTMDDIARELRISKKTIYRVFPDKASLVEACVDQVMRQVLPGAQASIEAEGPVPERLESLLQHVSRLPRLISPPFVGDLRSDYPALWEKIDARRRHVFARIGDVLSEGRARGEVRPEINPAVVQAILFAVLERVLIPERILAGEYTLAEAIDTLAAMFMHGTLAAAGTQRRGRVAGAPRAPAPRSRQAVKEARR